MSLLTCCLVVILISCVCGHENQYDTYNAGECKRIRRPWHLLTTEERSLYTEGLKQLRINGNGDINVDELIAIGSVHADEYSPFIHKTSSYLFFHGYFVWELESRIRNLGGKYKCFGLPYWDFTLEYGREDDPLIFNTDIGGNGDPNNYFNVNQYSWDMTVNEYWTPTDCFSQNDQYPLCSLKRSLRPSFIMPTAKQMGDSIINNINFIDFATDYTHRSGKAVHLIDYDPDDIFQFTQSYEPIWYLFHSFIQYHQAIWVDCNDYDLIDVDDLDNHPEAFTSYCNAYDTCSSDKYPDEWMKWELDDPIHFGGELINKEWSYIHNNDLTVRKLYMLPKWNIIYDLGNGDGFYTDSGLKEYCNDKLNSNWFILNNELENKEKDKILYLNSFHSLSSSIDDILLLICGFVFISYMLYYAYYLFNKQNKTISIYNPHDYNKYGSV